MTTPGAPRRCAPSVPVGLASSHTHHAARMHHHRVAGAMPRTFPGPAHSTSTPLQLPGRSYSHVRRSRSVMVCNDLVLTNRLASICASAVHAACQRKHRLYRQNSNTSHSRRFSLRFRQPAGRTQNPRIITVSCDQSTPRRTFLNGLSFRSLLHGQRLTGSCCSRCVYSVSRARDPWLHAVVYRHTSYLCSNGGVYSHTAVVVCARSRVGSMQCAAKAPSSTRRPGCRHQLFAANGGKAAPASCAHHRLVTPNRRSTPTFSASHRPLSQGASRG